MQGGREADRAEVGNPFNEMSNDRFTRDPNAVETFPVKLYRGAELVIEVCQEHGLSGKLRRPDTSEDFVVVQIETTYAKFRAAQLVWLSRMIANLPAMSVKSEPDLF